MLVDNYQPTPSLTDPFGFVNNGCKTRRPVQFNAQNKYNDSVSCRVCAVRAGATRHAPSCRRGRVHLRRGKPLRSARHGEGGGDAYQHKAFPGG